MSSCLRIERHGTRHELVLNRPDRGNRLSEDMVKALDAGFREAEAAGVALLVLRSEGDNFCTGFDLSDLDTASDEKLLARLIGIEQMLARVWSAPFVTLVHARGRSIGAGADLFVACRLRLAAPDARFSFPGAGFGLVLGTRRLGLRIGPERAGDILRAGREVSSQEAVQIGLATGIAVVPEMVAQVMAEEDRIAALGPGTVRALEKALRGPLAEGLDKDLAALVRSAAIPGLSRRIQAYRERTRPPRIAVAGGTEESTNA
ncbi:MAG: enoyl-CoA hydratase/isomerase family protein [Rhodobacteraceae bacterium]|nr:enoyl-CoA hydratase/isomerase family protein [Paracoccaceae bacterium]